MKAIRKFSMSALLVLGLIFSSRVLFANDKSSGCGPGWYIFKEMTIVSSVGRYLTNAFLFPLSTLGMTFGTSNCASHKLVEQYRKSLEFAQQSFDILRHDLVKGQGIHLSSYLGTFGCHSAIKDEISSKLQRELSQKMDFLDSPEGLVISAAQVIQGNHFYVMQCV